MDDPRIGVVAAGAGEGLEDGPRGIVGRGGDLPMVDAVRVDADQIGERPAGVDAVPDGRPPFVSFGKVASRRTIRDSSPARVVFSG